MAQKIKIRRIDQTKRTDDKKWKDLEVGLYSIDEMILYYMNEVIIPQIREKDYIINVPIMYGSPERWKSVQMDVGYRNERGTIMCPLIMLKRTNIDRKSDMPTTKIDAQNPQIFRNFMKKYSPQNKYTHFNVVSNQTRVKELYNVVIPDYVVASYDVIMWTDYVEQMNKLIEMFTYHGGSYWGNDYFRFRSQMDSFSDSVDLSTNSQRIVKSEFTLNVDGYIVPDGYLKKLPNEKAYSIGKVKVDFKVKK